MSDEKKGSITYNGKCFKAVEMPFSNGCDGCAFNYMFDCKAPHCTSGKREDGLNIIWKEEE